MYQGRDRGGFFSTKLSGIVWRVPEKGLDAGGGRAHGLVVHWAGHSGLL